MYTDTSFVDESPIPECVRNDETTVLQVLQAKGDHYAVLGATQDMSKEEIRSCYLKKSLECHPDKNEHPKATEAMQLVTAAWAFLQHSESRHVYDTKREKKESKKNWNEKEHTKKQNGQTEKPSKTTWQRAGRWEYKGPNNWQPAGEEEVPEGFPQSFGPRPSNRDCGPSSSSFGPRPSNRDCGPSSSSSTGANTHIEKTAPRLVCEFCKPGVVNESNQFYGVHIGRRDQNGDDLPLMVCKMCYKLVEHLKIEPGQPLLDSSDEEDIELQACLRISQEEALLQEVIRESMEEEIEDPELEEAIRLSKLPAPNDFDFAQAIAASLQIAKECKPSDISQQSACGAEPNM